MQTHCVPRWKTNRCLPWRGAGAGRSRSIRGGVVQGRVCQRRCGVLGASRKSAEHGRYSGQRGEIFWTKGVDISLGVTSDRSGLQTWLTTAGGVTLGQGSPPALLTGRLRDVGVTWGPVLCSQHQLKSHQEPLSLASPCPLLWMHSDIDPSTDSDTHTWDFVGATICTKFWEDQGRSHHGNEY